MRSRMAAAALNRAAGSISSELCDMAALRERAAALRAKDAEWQECMRSALLATEPMPPPQPESPVSSEPPRSPAHSEISAASPTIGDHPLNQPSEQLSEHPLNEAPPENVMQSRKKVPTPRRGRVGKIRRRRLTKEEEARYAPADLVDLSGTTAAKSRKMSEEERDIMLHKRRLRNRASAARSRDKQRKTIADIAAELDEVAARADAVAERCAELCAENEALSAANEDLKRENEILRRENEALRYGRGTGSGVPYLSKTNCSLPGQSSKIGLGRSGSMLRFSMSSDTLDKIIAGDGGCVSTTPRASGLLKVPSFLKVSIPEQSQGGMRKNYSYLDRMLEIGNYAIGGMASKNEDAVEGGDEALLQISTSSL